MLWCTEIVRLWFYLLVILGCVPGQEQSQLLVVPYVTHKLCAAMCCQTKWIAAQWTLWVVQLKLFTWGMCTLETADSRDLQASRPMSVLQHVNVAEAVRLVVSRFTGQLKTLGLPFKPNATGQATNVCALQSIYSYLHKVYLSADSHEAYTLICHRCLRLACAHGHGSML